MLHRPVYKYGIAAENLADQNTSFVPGTMCRLDTSKGFMQRTFSVALISICKCRTSSKSADLVLKSCETICMSSFN